MKKLVLIIIGLILIAAIVLFMPIPHATYDDGGTKEYKALTYKMIKWNRIYGVDLCYNSTRFYFGEDKNKSIDELWEEINPENEMKFSSSIINVSYTELSNIFEGCLNSKKLYLSSVQHLPIYKLETKAELERFKEKFGDALSFDFGGGEEPSFDESTASYDDAFFADNTLMLCYLTSGSGSFRFGVREVYCDGQSFCVYVEQTNDPEIYTFDMAGWLVAVEVKKSDIKSCTEFDAQLCTTAE